MVHKVRYSVGVALIWTWAYLMLWLLLSFVAGGLLWGLLNWLAGKMPDWVGLAIMAGVGLLGWVLHSRRYWSRLFDRSPQIELHPTFLRAKQLDKDIFWNEVQNIRGSQSGSGWDQGAKVLELSLVGGRRVELDLAALATSMERLYRLACDAREADAQRRQAGAAIDAAQEAPPPPAPVATTGHGAGELGEEIERFGPRGGGVFCIVAGAIFFIGMTGFAFWLDPTIRTPVVPMMSGMGSIAYVALFLQGLKILRAHLVLRQNGLTYVGLFRSYTVRYGDIQRTSTLSRRSGGSTEVTIELILRDGQVIKLSGFKDGAAAGQRTEALRSAAGRHDQLMGAEQSAAAKSPRD
jgi:hypothetical protein